MTRSLLLTFAPLMALLSGAMCAAQSNPDDPVAAARAALEKWVETRKVISKEKRDWATGREVLEDRIALVKREIDTLRGKLADADKNIAETEAKKDEVAQDVTKLKAATADLTQTIGEFETTTLALLRRLPEPLRKRLEPLSQRVPEDAGKTRLTTGERYANVVGLLNELSKANREITLTNEVRDLGGGRTAEVTTLYVGLARAYYVTAKGDAAGIGEPTDAGFVWSPANHLAADIARAVAIYKNEQVAAFVQLPVQVK